MSKMGINYTPSMRYKIHSRESNILKNPELELVLAQVDSNLQSLRSKSPMAHSKTQDERGFLMPPGIFRKRAKSLGAPSLMKNYSKIGQRQRSKTIA